MANRKAASDIIISYIDKIAPGNGETYKKLFASMSDKEFDAFISDLDSGEKFLIVISPNFTKNPITLENNLKIGDELGHNFFQRIWIEGKGDTPTYLTPNEYMVVDLPLRRASQLLVKKISVPKHNRVVDSLTGQPTGESKGAKISYPELQVAAAMGMENCMVELMKYRGGDSRGMAAMSNMLSKYGVANLDTLEPYSGGVESTRSLRTFLTSAHLKNNLG